MLGKQSRHKDTFSAYECALSFVAVSRAFPFWSFSWGRRRPRPPQIWGRQVSRNCFLSSCRTSTRAMRHVPLHRYTLRPVLSMYSLMPSHKKEGSIGEEMIGLEPICLTGRLVRVLRTKQQVSRLVLPLSIQHRFHSSSLFLCRPNQALEDICHSR